MPYFKQTQFYGGAVFVTVVIPTFNRASSLERCIRALPSDVEVIVADDGSTDETALVSDRVSHPQLHFVRKGNGGPASARNLGIHHAHGDVVAFTDDDCVPAPRWPHQLAERLRSEPATVGGVGGAVLPLKDGWISRYSTFHRILEAPPSISYLVTANCAYRRAVLNMVGGFDETIRTPGGEDPELAFRVRKAGYTLVHEASAVVHHDYRESLLDFAKTFYRYGRGCARVVA